MLPEDAPLYHDAIKECLADVNKTVCVDLRRSRTDGSHFWIRWEFASIVENERVTGFQALGTDASERKRAEQEILQAHEKLGRERYLLRTLIDHLPDPIYVKDTESRYIITNKAKLNLLGAKNEEETIGKTFADYFGEELWKEQLRHDKQVLSSGKPSNNIEELVVNKNGEKVWLLTTRVPLKNDDNKIIGFVGINMDITERKKITGRNCCQ